MSDTIGWTTTAIAVAALVGVLGFRGCTTSEKATEAYTHCAERAFTDCVMAQRTECATSTHIACKEADPR
jgi:hypothetical protein